MMSERERPVETILDSSTPPPPKPRGHFFVELESVRGIAALLVAGVHSANTPILVAGKQERLISTGYFGDGWELVRATYRFFVMESGFPHYVIPVFFVLSGFVLTASLEQGPASPGRAGLRFAIGRFFRIYPALVTTILVFWLAYVLTGIYVDVDGYPIGLLIRNALALDVRIDGVLWTVQSELMSVPLIFAAFLFRGRWKIGWIALMAIVFALMSFATWWV